MCPEDKTGNTQDGSQVIPMDLFKAEFFYPQCKGSVETEATVKKMAVEVADCLLTELRDPKKVTSNYPSLVVGEFSWGKTTDEEHVTGIGMMATNHPLESPFAALTQQLQCFSQVMGVHASAVGPARLHGDFDCSWKEGVVTAYTIGCSRR